MGWSVELLKGVLPGKNCIVDLIDKHVITCYNYFRKEVKRLDDIGGAIVKVLQGLAYLAILVYNGIRIAKELQDKKDK